MSQPVWPSSGSSKRRYSSLGDLSQVASGARRPSGVAKARAPGILTVVYDCRRCYNARRALAVSSHGYVMESGKVVLEGSATELMADQAVIDFYLGQVQTEACGDRPEEHGRN
mgnify:CR=1 FL=1